MIEIQGILPALVTPFDESGAFVEAAFEKLLERVFRANIDGIYVCGRLARDCCNQSSSGSE